MWKQWEWSKQVRQAEILWNGQGVHLLVESGCHEVDFREAPPHRDLVKDVRMEAQLPRMEVLSTEVIRLPIVDSGDKYC